VLRLSIFGQEENRYEDRNSDGELFEFRDRSGSRESGGSAALLDISSTSWRSRRKAYVRPCLLGAGRICACINIKGGRAVLLRSIP